MADSTSKRGFASMESKKQRAIASEGGHASHGGGNSSHTANSSSSSSTTSKAAGARKGAQGFAAMSEKERKDLASRGGHSQGKENNPANFANDPAKAAEAGHTGGQKSRRTSDAEK